MKTTMRLHPDSTGTLSELSEVVHWVVDKGRHVPHGTHPEGQTERKRQRRLAIIKTRNGVGSDLSSPRGLTLSVQVTWHFPSLSLAPISVT